MALNDRDYYRDRETTSWSTLSITARLIIINIAVYVIDQFVAGKTFDDYLGLHVPFWKAPWQLLTYGFLHDSHEIGHLVFNMIALFLFGRDVEGVYGPRKFLAAYLTAIIAAGLVWSAGAYHGDLRNVLVGASGGIMAIMVIFIYHFPKRTFYFNLLIPVPAWLLGVLYLGGDLLALNDPRDFVAHSAHLGGAAYGALFCWQGWTLESLWPGSWKLRRPRLKVHQPSDEPSVRSDNMQTQLDELLDKVYRNGEASLTPAERQTLQEISRRLQRRRQ